MIELFFSASYPKYDAVLSKSTKDTHMRKFIPFLVFVAACANKTPQPKVETLGWEEQVHSCNMLYSHILNMVAKSTLDSNYSPAELATAAVLLNKEMQDNGTAARFFSYCIEKMTPAQLQCSVSARTLDEMNMCRSVK